MTSDCETRWRPYPQAGSVDRLFRQFAGARGRPSRKLIAASRAEIVTPTAMRLAHRRFRCTLVLALAAALVAFAALGVSRAAASPSGLDTAKADCAYLTERGNAINKADVIFTKMAYSDGTITDDEYATSDWYTAQTAAIAKALAACIGGTAAPALGGVTLSGTTWSTASGDSLKINWSTDTPASVEVVFQHKVKGQEVEVGEIKVARGHRSVTFSGKAGSVQIGPGKYLVSVVATGAKGAQSEVVSKPLTVLP